MVKINERGTHTTIIEGALPILKAFSKINVEVSPGIIQANVTSKGRSVKLKKLNSETFEMVVVVKSSKQTFKVYGKDQSMIIAVLNVFKKDTWNVQDMLDISK